MNLNLYFLVEGKRTEARVYPEWLKQLLPRYTRVPSPDEAAGTSYFLISGEAYPRLLDVALPNSVADINDTQRYHYLIVCLDADECSVEERRQEVLTRIAEATPKLDPGVTAHVIVQNRSIETWFLGNRTLFPRRPSGQRFRDMAAFYDVSVDDPESMPVMPGYDSHADFHHEYLREMFRERKLSYSKSRTDVVADRTYLQALRDRVAACPTHLQTFAELVALCDRVHAVSMPAGT